MLELVEHLLGFGPLAAVGGDDERAVILFLFLGERDLNGRGFGGRDHGFVFAIFPVGDLNKAEAEFGNAIFEEAMLFGGEVALSFFLQHAEQVDGMAGQGQVEFWLFVAVFSEVEQAELHLGLHQDRFDEEEEVRRRDGEIGRICHTKNVSTVSGVGWQIRGCYETQLHRTDIVPASVRKELALDQKEAAEIFGGGVNAFSRYENGKTKPPLALLKLLKVLERHPDLLAEIKTA